MTYNTKLFDMKNGTTGNTASCACAESRQSLCQKIVYILFYVNMAIAKLCRQSVSCIAFGNEAGI